MTPFHLHALAAAWSLHTARQALADLAAAEAAQIAAERLEAAEPLRSPVWGSRHASGGHGDPVSTLLLAADRPARVNRWQEMADRATAKLGWLADQLREDTGLDPLARIMAALGHAQPGTAAAIHRHLADEDAWIRNATGAAPQREPLPGVECPHCGERQLYVQTAGPVDAWTVICATARLCVGEGCPCGMPGAVEGVAHIWPRTVVLGAVGGAR